MSSTKRNLAAERPFWEVAKARLERVEAGGVDAFASRAAYSRAYDEACRDFSALDFRSASPEEVRAAIAHVQAIHPSVIA